MGLERDLQLTEAEFLRSPTLLHQMALWEMRLRTSTLHTEDAATFMTSRWKGKTKRDQGSMLFAACIGGNAGKVQYDFFVPMKGDMIRSPTDFGYQGWGRIEIWVPLRDAEAAWFNPIQKLSREYYCAGIEPAKFLGASKGAQDPGWLARMIFKALGWMKGPEDQIKKVAWTALTKDNYGQNIVSTSPEDEDE